MLVKTMTLILSVLPIILLVPGISGDEDVNRVRPKILEEGDCSRQAKENDFIALHFTSKYEDGELISST